MPAFDQCHHQVVRALQKEGWRVDHSPFNVLTSFRRTIHIDLEVSRSVNGNRRQVLLIEVKCFPDENSTTRDLYTSIGQYLVYRAILVSKRLAEVLYLSIPEAIFNDIFDEAVIQVMREGQIKVVVIGLENEVVVQWIESWS